MTRPRPDEQKRKIKELEEHFRQKEGQTYYVVEFKWWQAWAIYVKYEEWAGDGDEPAEVANDVLLETPGDTNLLRKDLRELYDYVVVNPDVWNQLYSWYGGGPAIPRRVIAKGVNQILTVDLHPIQLTIQNLNPSTMGYNREGYDGPKELYFSRGATIKEVIRKAAGLFSRAPHKCRLWACADPEGMDGNWLLLKDVDTIAVLELEDGHVLSMEFQGADGSWPRDKESTTSGASGPVGVPTSLIGVGYAAGAMNSLSSNSRAIPLPSINPATTYRTYTNRNVEGKTPAYGFAGLVNLGNTCFMNSALQCLAGTIRLANHFLTNAHVPELNYENPLGTKGVLAQNYAIVMHEMFSDKYRTVAPTAFKSALGKFAPQFGGYRQQDAQELLSYLLDGLHEDLNRVPEPKPYVETVESDGREDTIVAAEAWEGHLKRNKSVVVDIFQGQFKSTVTCDNPECDRVSVTFDPSMYLSVPLPVTNERILKVTVVPRNAAPMNCSVKVPKMGSDVLMVKQALSDLTGLTVQNFVMADVYNHRNFSILANGRQVNFIRQSDVLFCHEVLKEEAPPPPPQASKPTRALSEDVKKGDGDEAEEISHVDSPPDEISHVDSPPDETPPAHEHMDCSDDDVAPGLCDASPGVIAEGTVIALPAPSASTSSSAPPIGYQAPTSAGRDALVHVQVVNRRKQPTVLNKDVLKDTMFGFPFTLSVKPSTMTGRELYGHIWERARVYYGLGDDLEVGAKKEDDHLEEPMEEEEGSKEETGVEPDSAMDGKEYPFPFTLCKTNITGATNISEIECNDSPLGWTGSQIAVAVDWDSSFIASRMDLFSMQKIRDHESVALHAEEAKATVPLEECIRHFVQAERLSKEDAWYCRKCADFRQAEKKFDLYRLPPVLVIHLKRFQYTRTWRDKIPTLITFPINGLDLREFVCGPYPEDDPPVYNLFAVSNHSGNMGGGHYTAFRKDPRDGQWYDCNDTYVSKVEKSEIISSRAYLLFYERASHTGGEVPFEAFEFDEAEVSKFRRSQQEKFDAERTSVPYGPYNRPGATAQKRRAPSTAPSNENAPVNWGLTPRAGDASAGSCALDDIDGLSEDDDTEPMDTDNSDSESHSDPFERPAHHGDGGSSLSSPLDALDLPATKLIHIAGCAQDSRASSLSRPSIMEVVIPSCKEPHKVWLDCDPGHDDAMAIILAGHNDRVDLLGVSTVYGNQTVEKTTLNALRVLALSAQRHVEVVKGATGPLLRELAICPEIHGESGLDAKEHEPHAREGAEAVEGHPGLARPLVQFAHLLSKVEVAKPAETKAVVAMYTEISKHEPGTVSLVATGCLTNVALLFKVFPEVKPLLKQVVIIGGAIGTGNTGAVAEFNIQIDPEAAKIVFESGVPLVQIPINVTHTCLVTPDVVDVLRGFNSTFGALMIALLNFFADTYRTEFHFEHPPLHDPLAIAYLIAPDIFETKMQRVDIETKSDLCAGQTVVDVWKQSGRPPNVLFAESVNVKAFWDLMLSAWEAANAVSPINARGERHG